VRLRHERSLLTLVTSLPKGPEIQGKYTHCSWGPSGVSMILSETLPAQSLLFERWWNYAVTFATNPCACDCQGSTMRHALTIIAVVSICAGGFCRPDTAGARSRQDLQPTAPERPRTIAAPALEFIDTGFENASPLWYETGADGEVLVHLMYDHERNSPNPEREHTRGSPAETGSSRGW
jgi:hypothetical protein